jgi:hypothetical protein
MASRPTSAMCSTDTAVRQVSPALPRKCRQCPALGCAVCLTTNRTPRASRTHHACWYECGRSLDCVVERDQRRNLGSCQRATSDRHRVRGLDHVLGVQSGWYAVGDRWWASRSSRKGLGCSHWQAPARVSRSCEHSRARPLQFFRDFGEPRLLPARSAGVGIDAGQPWDQATPQQGDP